MISPMPGAVPLKPGSGTLPLPGVHAPMSSTCRGKPVGDNREGYPDHPAAVAEHDPHHLGRSRALQTSSTGRASPGLT